MRSCPSCPRLAVLFVLPLALPTPTHATVCWTTPDASLCADPVVVDVHVGEPVILTMTAGNGLSAVAATVNGEDVSSSFQAVGSNTYTLMYALPDPLWPWLGLSVAVTLSDDTSLSAYLVPGAKWSEDSNPRGLDNLSNSDGRGLCMGDVDGDGDVDVFAAMIMGTANQLWINNGAGEFTDERAAWGLPASTDDRTTGCGFADVDSDGRIDLLVALYQDDVMYLFMNTGGGFVDESHARGFVPGTAPKSFSVAWGDVNGDGAVDLHVANFGPLNKLFMNNGDGVFVEDALRLGVAAAKTRASLLVDIDQDSDLDLLVANSESPNQLFINAGNGTFVEDGASRGFAYLGDCFGMAAGDWTANGSPDVFVALAAGTDLLYINNGTGAFTELGGLTDSVSSFGVVMLDIENDGDVDVFVGRSGADMVWMADSRSGASNAAADLTLGSSNPTYGVAAGDIDGDGDVDVLAGFSGDLFINNNARPGVPKSVTIRPVTHAGAPSAFGAAVRLVCTAGCGSGAPWTALRTADGGSGFCGQSAYDAVIGVHHQGGLYNATVRWTGDSHPAASWSTHPGLGRMAPGPAPIVVRPVAVTVSSVATPPWDFAAVTTRAGGNASAPLAGDVATLTITLFPVVNLFDVNASVTVNSLPVAVSWLPGGFEFEVVYTTAAGDETWPWTGLDVEVALVDGAGLVSSHRETITPHSTWGEEAAVRGMSGLASSASQGVCMADVDGDGDVDVFVAMNQAANQLWVNYGSGVFSDEAGARGVTGPVASSAAVGCGFADADDDGFMDLMVVLSSDNSNQLFMGSAGGVFVEDGDSRRVGSAKESSSVTWGDVDGDGDVDAYVGQGFTHPNTLFINRGLDQAGSFDNHATSWHADAASQTRHAVMVDVTGDAYLDIITSNADTGLDLYVNMAPTGSLRFTEDGAPRGLGNTTDAVGVAVGDVTGDSFPDIYACFGDAWDTLFVNNGTGVFTEAVPFETGSSQGGTMADLDLDADLDIVVGVNGGLDAVLVNGGGGTFTSQAAGLGFGDGGDVRGVAAGDLDGDGDVDVFMAKDTAHLGVNHNARPQLAQSLTFRPLTAGGSQSAFGSRVHLVCVYGCTPPWSAVRVIDSGGGFSSQNAYDAVIGVPVSTAHYNATVAWVAGSHPTASPATHTRLGGIVPALLAPQRRLFVVRPAPVTVSVFVAPWDTPGLGAPGPGSQIVLQLTLAPAPNSGDVSISLSSAGKAIPVVNSSLATHTASSDQKDWLWEGLSVRVEATDSAGLAYVAKEVLLPGAVLGEETAARGLSPSASSGTAACAGDYDMDGMVDVYVTTQSFNQLWHNLGNGSFEDVAAELGVTGGNADQSYSCSWVDVDNSGLLALYVGANFDPMELYVQRNGVFVAEGPARGLSYSGYVRGHGFGDLDGNGFVDVFVPVSSAADRLFLNTGGIFTRATDRGIITSTASASEQALLLDVEGDGDLDVFVMLSGSVRDLLYINDGRAAFLEQGGPRGLTSIGSSATGAVVGDVDNDAVPDIIAFGRQRSHMYINDGSGVFTRVIIDAASESVECMAVLDVDVDGDIDLVALVHDSTAMMLVGQEGTFSASFLYGAGASNGAVVALDADNDGDQDVFYASRSQLFINHMASATVPRSVRVRPLTSSGAPSAFGSAVVALCVAGCPTPWHTVRLIDGGSGRRGSADYDAHFGLPALAGVYNFSVTWAASSHTPSTWASHPRLGTVAAATLPPGHVVVVRPSPVTAHVGALEPWPFGLVDQQVVRIPIVATPGAGLLDVIVDATVNGIPVPGVVFAGGTATLRYLTPEGDTTWVWDGFHVDVTLEDSGGLVTDVHTWAVPGSTYEPAAVRLGVAAAHGAGVCMGDVDGDGAVEVLALGAAGSQLWAGTSGGGFHDVAAAWGLHAATGDGCAFGDANGDTHLDLVLTSANRSVVLLVNSGNGTFTEHGLGAPAAVGAGPSWGDTNGDGAVDLALCGAAVLRNNGSAGFLVQWSAVVPTCQQTTLVDLTNDGHLDLITAAPAVLLFVNNGTGGFGGEGASLNASARAVVVVDVDADGSLDLYLSSDAGDAVLLNDGFGGFVAAAAPFPGSSSRGAVALDLEHDGDVDILAAQAVGPVVLAANLAGGTVWQNVTGVVFGGGAPTAICAAVADLDGDMDLDVWASGGGVWVNHNRAHAVSVMPLSAAGAPAVAGATVRLVCTTGCPQAWAGVRVMDGGGSMCQSAYGALFAVPWPDATYNVAVLFPGGALQDATIQAHLGGVRPGAVVEVLNRPYWAAISAAPDPPLPLVNVSASVKVTLVAGQQLVGLRAAAGCCFVNGVQVAPSFSEVGAGVYTLDYHPELGEPSWAADALPVLAPVRAPGGASSDTITVLSLSSPGDLLPPAVVFDCAPSPSWRFEYGQVCASCPTEVGCTFWFSVQVGSAPWQAVAGNTTSATAATVRVGPHATGDTVRVWAVAQDAALYTGNATVEWVVDMVPPSSFVVSGPVNASGNATVSRDATFLLGCNEECSFAAGVDGAPLAPLGGNATGDGGGGDDLDTVLVRAPHHVVATPPAVSFEVTVDDGATVYVVVDDGQPSLLAVVHGTNATAPFPLDASLADGRHVVVAWAEALDGARDVTPLQFVFELDTVPPSVGFAEAPSPGVGTAVVFCDDPGATYHWRVAPSDDLAATAWVASQTGVLTVPDSGAGGEYGLEVFPVDEAGNVGGSIVAFWLPSVCPLELPSIALDGTAEVGAGARHVAITVGNDTGDWLVEYAADGGAWTTTHRRFVTFVGLAPGPHQVAVRPVVPAGCPPPPPSNFSWEEPPTRVVVVFEAAPPATTPDAFAEFVIGGSTGVWLQCRLDTAPRWAPCDTKQRIGPLGTGGHVFDVRPVSAAGGGVGDALRHEWTVAPASDSTVVLSNLPEGLHSLSYTATDAAGVVEESVNEFLWRVDTTLPVTVVNRTSGRVSTSLTATVAVACVGEQDACGFSWTSPTASVAPGRVWPPVDAVQLTAGGDGVHVVLLSAVDSVGNVGEAVAVEWVSDTSPPGTAILDVSSVLVGGVLLPAHAIALNLTADEALAGVVTTVNGREVSPAGGLPAGVFVVDGFGEGVLNVTAAAVDLAGNVDPSPARLDMFVDTLAPTTSFLALPPALSRSPTLNASVAVADGPGSGGVTAFVTLSAAGMPTRAQNSTSAVFANLTSGVYRLEAAGVDAAGNVDASPASAVVEVDLVPPVAQFAPPPPPLVNTTAVTLHVNVSEGGAVVSASLADSGPWVEQATPGVVVVGGLSDGPHVLRLRAVDAAGNHQPPPYPQAGVVVDTETPIVFWTEAPPAYTDMPSVRACFGANDSNAVVFEAVAPGGAVVDGPCVDAHVGAAGRHAVTLIGRDEAGNAATLEGSFVFDASPPVAVVEANVSAASPTCVTVSGVVACGGSTAALLSLGCTNTAPPGGGVELAPCRPQFAVATLDVAVGASCGQGRRLAGEDVVWQDAPTVGAAFSVGTFVDGWHSVAVRAVDAAGNVQTTNTTLEWWVDTAAPAVAPEFVVQPEKVNPATAALFVVRLVGDASPGQTRFVYSLDDGPVEGVGEMPTPNTANVQLELMGLAAGSHKVEVWAVDQAGNTSPSVVYDWTVITEAPGVVVLGQPAAVSGDALPTFKLMAVWDDGAAEPAAALEVALGGGELSVACADTNTTAGVCVWNASLAAGGPGTYTLSARAALGGLSGDPSTVTWEYKVCGDDEFAVLNATTLAISCQGCPVGGNCAGGLTGQAEIAAVRGFWAPEGSSGLRFYECPVEEACLPGGDVVAGNTTVRMVGRCAEGYKGTLCAVCEDGFFEQFGACASCGAQSGVAWLIMFAVLVAVIGVGVLFFKFKDVLPTDLLKVVLSMLQIVASANTAYAIPWPPLFSDFLNTMRVFLIDAVSLTRANCAQPMTFFGSLVVTLVGFKVVLAVVVLLPVVAQRLRGRGARPTGGAAPQTARRRRSSVAQAVVASVQAVDWAKIFKITFLFLFVAYPGVSLMIMKTFKCVEVEGDFWLVADMRLRCYEGAWFGYALYALVMGCLYTGGLPLAITVILWRNRGRLGEAGVVAKWGFLFEAYGVGAYLWEAEELLRKLWLSALVVLMKEGSPLQVTTAVLISGWAHVLHAVYKPWQGVGEVGPYVYVLQHGSLLVTFFVFLMGLLFKVEGVSQDGTTYNVLAWAMMLACVVFLVAACVVVLVAVLAQLRAMRTKHRVVRAPAAAPAHVRVEDHQRAVAVPRAVRTSRMGARQSVAWVGNPLRAGNSGMAGEGTI